MNIDQFCSHMEKGQITNKMLVDFVHEYGKNKFFIDLYKLLNIFWSNDMYKRFSIICYNYHLAKQYFNEHK
jgi:hypothetical protein